VDQLNQITTFVKVVERGGFAAAARALGIAPSMVTAHIQALEKRLGARLLNRNTRRVSMTEIGEAYWARCTDILKRLEEAEGFVESMQTKPRGTLRLNTSLLIQPLVTRTIPRFAEKYPDVSVEMVVTGRFVDLVEEKFDLAIRHAPPPGSSLIVRKLADFRFVICGSPKYFETRPKPQTPLDLKAHNCLLYSDCGSGGRWTIFNTEEDIVLNGNLRSNSVVGLIKAAEEGQGLVAAPHFTVEESLRAGRLVAVLTGHTAAPYPITVIYPHRGLVPSKAKLFVDMLAEHLHQIPAAGMDHHSDRRQPRGTDGAIPALAN
jgi:DNA-binding transcriptional LysR family regulator